MTKSAFRCLSLSLFALLCGGLSSLAVAADASNPASGDISGIFCDDLAKEDIYDKNKFEAYKMLVPGTDGWIFRTSRDLSSRFSLDFKTRTAILAMQRALEKKGIEFAMIFVPTRGMVHYDKIRPEDREKFGFTDIDAIWASYNNLIREAQSVGIHIVGIDRANTGPDFFYKRDHHWSQAGAHQAAKELARYIRPLPAYETLKKTEFTTKNTVPYNFNGASDKVFSKICKTAQPPEHIIKTITAPVAVAEEKNDLFGDTLEPEVVLLGTSNSKMEPSFSNFEGFLKEELQTDILNMSVSGAGIDTAMIAYLNTDHYKKGKARLLIWEVPGYYDLEKQLRFFRQAMPAISNDCGAQSVAHAENIKLIKNNTLVLDGLAGQKITGDGYYVYLKFSAPVKKPFSADLQYVNDRDQYKLKRSGRYPHDGEFYFTLKNSKKDNLDKLILQIPAEMNGLSVDAKICKIND